MKHFYLFFCMVLCFGSWANAQISGTVYRDFNGNGVMDNVAPNIDSAISGVIVNAYNASDILVATQTTNSSGIYSFPSTGSNSIASGVTVRLEFIVSSTSTFLPSLSGIQNGTSVQFVTAGSGATNIDYAVNNPNQYYNTAPKIVTTSYASGDPSLISPTPTSINAVHMWQLNNNGSGASNYTTLGTEPQVGSTFGIAYQRNTQNLYIAALVKRNARMGPAGIGGIYVINNPTGSSPSSPSTFVDLATFTNLGSFPSNATRGVNVSAGTPTNDPLVFSLVGKQGLGDMDLSEDNNYLWVVDLTNRQLIKLNVTNGATPTLATTSFFPLGSASGLPTDYTGGVLRPFGLKFNNGYGYLGVVSTGESTADPAQSTVSPYLTPPSTSVLRAYVLRFNPNQTGSSMSFTTVLDIPLNYTKGQSTINQPIAWGKNWHYWNDQFSSTNQTIFNYWQGTYGGNGGNNGLPAGGESQWNLSRPMPMLADIEFDYAGNMVIGLRDRGGDMFGSMNYAPDASNYTLDYRSGGDILKAAWNGSAYTLESNGISGGSSGAGVGNGQGPGGGEFFDDNSYAATDQQEIFVGGLAMRKDSNYVIGTVYDPGTTTYFSQGIRSFNNSNGALAFDKLISAGSTVTGSFPGTPSNGRFGKANGMGDLEILYDNAPIEIGNRLWLDTNKDGIQEPGEAGIGGVQLQLYNPATSTVIGTVTTAADGTYYFTSAAGTSTTGKTYGLNILPNTNYIIRLATGAGTSWDPTLNGGLGGAIPGSPLSGLTVTTPNATGNGATGLSNSKATIVSSVPQASVTTTGYGASNETIDMGWVNATFNLSGNVFDDANGLTDNTVNGTGTGLPSGTQLYANLINSSGIVQATVPVNPNGTYNFAGVTPGTYSVQISTNQGTVNSAPPATALPSGWVNTGENLGTTAGSDGMVNGILPSISLTTTDVTNANFGIEQLPNAINVSKAIAPNPGSGVQVSVPTLNGSDPEQGIFPGTGNMDTVIIQTLPANGTLYYNNIAVKAGDTIKNYNPSLLTIAPNFTGAGTMTFTYSEVDAALQASAPATVTIPLNANVNVSGTVFNDVNGMTDTYVNGTGINPGGLNANLLQSGLVIATTLINADGTYQFTNVSAGAYTVQISTNAGTPSSPAPATVLTTGWVNTGANNAAPTVTGTSGTSGSSAPFMVSTSNVPNINFGIEQPPTPIGGTAPIVVNPEYTNQSVNEAYLFTGTDPSSSSVTGIVTSLTINAFPTGATSLVVNGVTYLPTDPIWPANGGAGIIVPTNAAGTPTVAITVDPAATGATTVTIPFVNTDNAGVVSPTSALVTIPFSAATAIMISGNVFYDANGLSDGLVNGTSMIPNGINAILIDPATNTVIGVQPVPGYNQAGAGMFSFGAFALTQYQVIISTANPPIGTAAPTSSILPAGYINTGNVIGTGTGGTNTTPGMSVLFTTGSTDLTNINFGIIFLPTFHKE